MFNIHAYNKHDLNGPYQQETRYLFQLPLSIRWKSFDVISGCFDIRYRIKLGKLLNNKCKINANYDQDYYSLNEVALGSELQKHTYDDKEHQNIDRIDHGEYEYYDYDFENEDFNSDNNNENYYDYENDSSDYDYESDKANEVSKESYDETEEDGDYEVYYTYYYDYIDPEELQSKFEKLPDPSYQTASNSTTLSNEASSNTTLPFLESGA